VTVHVLDQVPGQVLDQGPEQGPEQEPEYVPAEGRGGAAGAAVGGHPAPAVRWEPCAEASGPDELGLCAGCGWPADDHQGLERGPASRVEVVIRVPDRPRLRRAS